MGVSSEFYAEKEQQRKMASETSKKRAQKESKIEGGGGSVAKKAKITDKPTMADYMPRSIQLNCTLLRQLIATRLLVGM